MRRFLSLALPLLCLTVIGASPIAVPPGQAAPDLRIRQRIKDEMAKAQPGEVLAFDEDGFLLKQLAPPKKELERADSLESFLGQYTRQTELAESNSRGGIKGTDPIASCDEPKGLPRPPECVVCKNGKTICAQASFAKQQKKGASH